MLRKRKSIKRNKKKREKEKRGKKLEDIIEKKLKKKEERWHLFRKPLLTTRGLVSRFVLQSIISYDSNL
jgi:hypothetical protein